MTTIGVGHRARSPELVGAVSGLVTVALYALGIGRSLDYDSAETVGFFVRTGSVLDALRRQRAFNNHPMFSLAENAISRVVGTTDEAVLRVLPITAAGCAVALVGWGCTRRWGPRAGVAAAAVLATNPLFAELSRSVRGYSLLVLALVVASALLFRLLDEGGVARPSTAPLYVSAVAIAVATHLYAVVALSGHVVVVVARRRFSGAWFARWLLAVALGGLFYVSVAGPMLQSVGERGRRFQPGFPMRLAVELLGGTGLSVVLLGGVALAAVVTLRHRPEAIPLVGWAVAVTALAWVSAGTDLAPRFFVWMVPLVAVLAAAAVGRWPPAGLAVAVAVVASVWSVAPAWTAAANPYPEAAALVDAQAAAGRSVCVLDLSVPPLLAYTDRFDAVTRAGQLDACDVVVTVAPTLDAALADAADRRFADRTVLGPPGEALVWSREPLEGEG